MLGVIRLLPKTTASIYQALTQIQKQTVQAMVWEMLDTQAKVITDITKTIPKPKEKMPPSPRGARKPTPTKTKPIPEKEKVPRRPKAAKKEPPLKLPVIPKLRPVEKKKVVKVKRRVTKEYTNFQIVNQIGGIAQLFG
jgi:hypothetical protein